MYNYVRKKSVVRLLAAIFRHFRSLEIHQLYLFVGIKLLTLQLTPS